MNTIMDTIAYITMQNWTENSKGTGKYLIKYKVQTVSVTRTIRFIKKLIHKFNAIRIYRKLYQLEIEIIL